LHRQPRDIPPRTATREVRRATCERNDPALGAREQMVREKTERLKALRLAKETADKESEPVNGQLRLCASRVDLAQLPGQLRD